jgi:hypothetical protein
MNPDDLARILDELGQRLGPTGEYVFALAVRQVYIEAILFAIVGLGSIAGGVYIWRRVYRTGDDIDRSYGPPVAVLAVATGLFLLLFCGIAPALNPEYAAIRDILGAIP